MGAFNMNFMKSESWIKTVEIGLGARHINTIDSSGLELLWSVFTRGPVKAAYVNFPVGLEKKDASSDEQLEQHLKQLKNYGVSFANISAPKYLRQNSDFSWLHKASLPETVIDDLQNWSLNRIAASSRRKVTKSITNEVSVRTVNAIDGELLYQMYTESIRKHSGKTKYTKDYFLALCRLCSTSTDFSLGIVKTKSSESAGFIVIGHAERVSYYLHGGMLEDFKSLSPGHIAMVWGIEQARLKGSDRFNMLTSPASQHGLIRFKECMGGGTYSRHHYQISLNTIGLLAVSALSWVGKIDTLFRLQK